MPTSRNLYALLCIALCCTPLTRQPAAAAPSQTLEEDKILHLLNRISYGPLPGQISKIEKLGINNYIEQQLNPDSIELPEEVAKLASKDTVTNTPAQLFLTYGPPAIQGNLPGQPNNKFGQFGNRAVRARQAGNFEGSGRQARDTPFPIQLEPAAPALQRRRAQVDTPTENADGEMMNNADMQSRSAQELDSERQEHREPDSRIRPGGIGRGAQSGQSPQKLNRSFPDLPGGETTGGDLGGRTKNKQNPLGEIHKKFYGDLTKVRLTRVVESPRQLEELMVDFWFNHFNVSFDKGLDHIWTGTYEEHAIRPYALGKFRDLLGATAHHAAMSFYLDNWQNTAPESPGARGKLQGLNENYARELLELHTLGVDGGYTQKDVISLARVLTGFGFRRQQRALRSSSMLNNQTGTSFDASRHDFNEKTLLEHVIRGSGESEIEEALDLLATHPSTAKHLSFKLAQYFVADDPPASLVQKMAARFTATGGDIKAVLRTMLQSDEFWSSKYVGCKFKTPYRYLVSSLRATECRVSVVTPCVQFLSQSGMPLYRCLTPDGYKNTRSTWLNPDALVKRINLATALGTGRWPGNQPVVYDYREALPLLGSRVSPKTLEAVRNAQPPLRLALVLGSPEFMMY